MCSLGKRCAGLVASGAYLKISKMNKTQGRKRNPKECVIKGKNKSLSPVHLYRVIKRRKKSDLIE